MKNQVKEWIWKMNESVNSWMNYEKDRIDKFKNELITNRVNRIKEELMP